MCKLADNMSNVYFILWSYGIEIIWNRFYMVYFVRRTLLLFLANAKNSEFLLYSIEIEIRRRINATNIFSHLSIYLNLFEMV